jgi:hypothetical protein
MNDLSREARMLLAVARNVTVPTGHQRHEIKRSVLLRVAALTAASAGAGAAGATSLASKLVLTGMLATAVTGGTYGVWRWRASVEAPPAARGERAAAARQARTRPLSAPAPTPQPEARPEVSPLGLASPPAPARRLATYQPAHAGAASPPRTPPPANEARAGAVAAPRPEVLAPPDLALPTESLGARAGTASEPPALPVPSGDGRILPVWPTPAPATHAVAEPQNPPVAPQVGQASPAWPTPVPQTREARESRSADTPSGSTRPLPTLPAGGQGSLVREVALLRRAHEALRDGQPQSALRMLVDYDREFPSGALREERDAIAVIAGCQAEPGPHARRRAQELLRAAPGSLLADRVRAACQLQKPVAK